MRKRSYKNHKKLHFYLQKFVWIQKFSYLCKQNCPQIRSTMESITFSCTKSEKQIARAKRLRPLLRVLVFIALLMIVGCLAIPLIALIPGVLKAQTIWKAEMFWPCLILLAVLIGLTPIIRYLFGFVLEDKEITRMQFDIMPDKTFGWDADKHEMVYKDKYRSLRFRGDEVDKWVSVRSQYGNTTDIMRLRNGEQIVLEDFFNKDIYPFLHQHQAELGLPKSKGMTLVVNYYQDPI